jgi:acyl-CoA reductase-like NAD-dependent aldehyde dehydrogenase
MTVKPNFINGKWVEARAHLENINPSDISDVVGHFSIADPSQVLEAIEAAKKSHLKLVTMTPQQRFDALDFIGSEILQRVDELADLLAREEGKALPDAKAEVNRASQIFKFFAGEALRLQGEIVTSTRPNMSVEITREPVGVVAVISPWNFPIAIPAWKIAPALAYGNAVVFKPSELAPASAWALTEIISRSSFPSGSFNLLMGYGRDLGPAMIHDSRVDAVTFTGSEATGRLVASSCVNRNGHIAKFQLEMGGKNPLVVLDDADLDIAVECAVNGAFFSTGQRCTASSRLIVTEKIHDEFVTKLIKRMSQLKVGDARAADTNIGPVIDQNQLDKDLQFIQIGQDEGAYLAYGGDCNSIVSGKNGFYLQPTLFTNASNKMRICQEEIFGPIAAVIRVKDAEEALQIANDTPYGLSAGVCTTSLKQASKFKRQLLAGMVMINAPTAGVDPHVPFGGRKSSNFGTRELGRYASEFYTVVKTTYLNS